MPNLEIKYSSDLNPDFPKMFGAIEKTINELDPSAGVCKCRAYPSSIFLHMHMLVEVLLLEKPHRNMEFTKKLTAALEREIKKYLLQGCYFSIVVDYNPPQYVTNQHRV